MKKILFVVNVDWFFVSHRLPIAIEAIRQGYDVHLACSVTDKKQELENYGIIVHEVPFSRSGNGLLNELLTLKSLRKVICSVRPEILHAVTIKPVIYSGILLRTIKNAPAFVAAISGLGYVFSAQNLKAKIIRFIVSIMYRFALSSKRKMVIFQNTSDEKILSEIVGLKQNEKVLIKGSGADLNEYDYKPENLTGIKKVAMASRLLREKGVYEFVEAARLVKDQVSDVEFLLVGSVDEGNPNSVKQDEVDNWHRSKVIKALGHRTDVATIFSDSNIVVLPSFYGEGVPKVLIEAAACGRAIITTDKPGCRDAVIQGVTGITVTPQDAVVLSDAILKLLQDDFMRQNMGIQGRKYAEQEFDVRSVVAKHISIYESF